MQLKRFLSLILFSVLLITLLFTETVFAQKTVSENKRVIKVALPSQYGFAEKDANGNNSGYTYDFLMKIAQRIGWEYEFVIYGNSNQQIMQSITDLKEGKVDLCGAMTFSDELAKTYEFTKQPYGYVEYVLLSQKSNETLNYRTLHNYPNLRFALVETAVNQNKLLEDYCKSKNISYTVVNSKSSAECRELIDQGKADAFISKNVVDTKDYKIIANLGKQPFYFATNKQNSHLAKQIDGALEDINTIYPNYMSELYQKYFTEEYDLNLALSTDEREFLQTKPVLRVSVLENAPPWQYYDSKEGEYKGITVGLLKEISEICDINFELVSVNSVEQATIMAKNGQLDIISSLPSYFPLCDELNIWLTTPYMYVPIVYISNSEAKVKNQTELITSEIAIVDKKDSFIIEDNVNKIFSLVDSGDYKGAYLDSYSAQHNIATFSNHNVSLTSLPYSGYSFSIGVSKQCDNRVLRILDQAILTIPKSKVEAIIYENTTHSHKISFFETIMRNPIQVILVIAVFFSIITVLLIIIFLRTKKLNKLISQEKNKYMEISQKDRLTMTYNNVTFKKLASDYLEQSSNPCCGALLVCDIDDFKLINDKFGHLEGDRVISKLGEIMAEIFNEKDILGRLGGDEMMALIKDSSDIKVISQQCEKLAQKCTQISDNYKVTLSVGVCVFNNKTKFNTLFKSADIALYQVKNNNKNSYKIVE